MLGAMALPPPDCSEIQADRDYNYALKMAFKGDRRSREGRRTLIRRQDRTSRRYIVTS